MYRLLLIAALCRAVLSASTTPPTPDKGADIKSVIVNNGGEGPGETQVGKIQHDKEEKIKNEFEGHGSKEAEILKEEEEYLQWLEECSKGNEVPEVNKVIKAYLSDIDMSEDDLKKKCEEMKQSGRKKRYIMNKAGIWHKCIIPYIFDTTMSEDGKKAVLRVHEEFKKKTGFRFVPFNNSNADMGLDHNNSLLYIDERSGCWSYVGNLRPSSNRQRISPCKGFALVMHEIGHALGFQHEHSDPEADYIMRPNYNNLGNLAEFRIHNLQASHNGNNFYDLTSTMHYPNWGTKKGYGYKMNVDELELTKLIGKEDYYYLFRDMQVYHKCYNEFASCTPLPDCKNDGYPSVVNGVCACACPEGLDPATNCSSIIGDKTTVWPKGTYSLLKVKGSECPSGFEFGRMTRWNSGWQWDNGIYISGGKDVYSFIFDVCTRTSSVGSKVWPKGKYCFLKRGDCPNGFEEGLIESWGRAPDKENSSYGALPDGKKGQDFEFRFCCRDDGTKRTPISLPNKETFILYDGHTSGCQKVEGTNAIKDYYMAKNENTKLTLNRTLVFNGSLPYLYKFDGIGMLYYTYYCVYYPLTKEISGKPCGVIKHFSADETTYEFTTPNFPDNYPANQECLWYFESPADTTMKIEFTDFAVSSSNDADCKSFVELKTLRPGMTGYKICGHYEVKSRLTVYNRLMVKFHSSEKTPQKGFKATVTVLKEADQCYNGKGQNSYAGTVNYSRNMKPCIPWSQVRNCPLGQFATSATNVDLSHSYCRNVMIGRMPWCYVHTELCVRENCDACMTDRCYDVLPDCASIVREDSTFCTKNELGEAKRGCMKTCGFCAQHTPAPAYSTVKCKAPGTVADIIPTPAKDSYNVGDQVEYKCANSDVVRKRTCRSDGNWSPLSYVCSGCSDGWTYIRGRCYKWLPDIVKDYAASKKTCAALNSNLVTVESDEQLNGVMALLNYDKLSNIDVWFDIKYSNDDKAWKWQDGTNSNYISWRPKNSGSENTASWDCVAGTTPNTWYTSWCGWTRDVICNMLTTGTFECVDDLPNCDDIIAKTPDMCETFPDYAWTNCRKTCGVTGCTGTKTCSVPTVANAQQTHGLSDSVNQGQYIEFKCNEGFYLSSGKTKTTCLSTGSFGNVPVCSAPSDVNSISLFADVELFRRRDYADMKYPVVANIDTTRLNAAGNITTWTFFASQAGEVTMLVWRPTPENSQEYTLIGKNKLTVTANNRAVNMDVSAGDQISVQKGDVFGLVMATPVITFSSCNGNNMPDFKPWSRTSAKFQPDQLELNKAYTFRDCSKSCRVYSIRVTMNPSA